MIDILLATYNGEKYIDTQISSIVNQTYTDWKLYIHDDGSTDSTVEKIKHWHSLDSRIIFIEDGIVFREPGRHFFHLMKYSTSDFICFADQDDLWFENKLSVMYEHIDKISLQPELVICGCYLWNLDEYSVVPKIDFSCAHNLYEFLFLNGGLQGCAMLFNAALRSVAFEHDLSYLYMHDYLISLVAFTFGSVIYIDKKLFLYRQHEYNTSVHLQESRNNYIWQVMKNTDVPIVYAPAYKTVKSFFGAYAHKMTKEKACIYRQYLAFPSMNIIKRFFSIIFSKFSIGKNGHTKLVLKLFVRSFWRETYE